MALVCETDPGRRLGNGRLALAQKILGPAQAHQD